MALRDLLTFGLGPDTGEGTYPTASDIADAVCDELLSGHTGAGSLGKAISDILTATSDLATDDEIAAKILVTPANLLTTDASGRVSISGTKNTLDALLLALQGSGSDTLLSLATTLTAIKGVGWTTETLVALDVLLDAIKAKTDALDVTGTPTVVSLVDGGDLTVIAAATFDPAAITGLTIPATWTSAYFTVKTRKEASGMIAAADATAVIQIKISNPGAAGDGLLYLNGAVASSAAYGSLALDAGAGTATIVLADDATVRLAKKAGLFWDVKTLNSDGTSDVVCSGTLDVVLTPTKTV